MPAPSTDEKLIGEALSLAGQGAGLASPNPYVGAVIVDNHGVAVGRGFHTYAGVKHAEILAIEQAGAGSRGGTLYINLEPCSHRGRTGPCADAVIAAGIQRVVASIADPNPLVSGQGFAKLRNAGIAVEVGLLAEPARRLNEAFARYIRDRRPLITLKSALSLDGQIAAGPAKAITDRKPEDWITGDAARAHVQTLRHQHDAILTGVGTVLADSPSLTDRSGLPRRRKLLRVVLDSQQQIPLDSPLVQSASPGDQDVLVFCSSQNGHARRALEERGVSVEVIRGSSSGVDLSAVFRRLGELEIISVLCEGGTRLNSALLQSGLVDKAFLYFAPKFLRNPGSAPFANLAARSNLSSVRVHQFGDDVALEGYFRDPYTS